MNVKLQPPPLCLQTLQEQLPAATAKVLDLGTEALARHCGFLRRTPRKIPMPHFLQGLLALAPETDLSLERMASVIGLTVQDSYSKQALSQRLSPALTDFLAKVITGALGQFSQPVEVSPLLTSFARVLVQDSTLLPLPAHLAALFPGGGNQSSSPTASLKIQWVCDLKNSAVAQLRLSGFTRNDQRASADILEALGPGDLVLRDLGYLSVPVLGQVEDQGAFFLSRHLPGTRYYEPASGRLFDLASRLRRHPSLDLALLAGAERVPVRLVALPVPEEVANRRRQKARASARHRQRPPPSPEYLFLMGWNILLTNVPASLWPPKALVAVYRLRWRIEIIFKTWKSYLGLPRLNCRTARLLELSVLTKLLFCALVSQMCDALELHCGQGRHVSLLRLGHILEPFAGWFSATILGIPVVDWLEFSLAHHVLYDRRKDRQNYYETLATLETLT
jgi:Transposase DDE domain